MIPRVGGVYLKVLSVCAAAGGGFALGQAAMRTAEAAMALSLLHLAGAAGVSGVGPTTLLVVPDESAAFHVLITPSCSSVASVIAFMCLTPVLPASMFGRVRAFVAATVLVVAGNLLRIAGSLAIGLAAGRSSLVLFHDWVGSMFTVVYTLTGYIVMLRFVLPSEADRPTLPEATHALAHAR